MCNDLYGRIISKKINGVATVPASSDHRNGDWIDTDIYENEFAMDINTGIIYSRIGSTILTVTPTVDDGSTNRLLQGATSIGAWDMDATASVNLTLDLDVTKVVSISVVILNDAQTVSYSITDGGAWSYSGTDISLFRDVGGAFDSTAYDDTGVNRGFVYYTYYL